MSQWRMHFPAVRQSWSNSVRVPRTVRTRWTRAGSARKCSREAATAASSKQQAPLARREDPGLRETAIGSRAIASDRQSRNDEVCADYAISARHSRAPACASAVGRPEGRQSSATRSALGFTRSADLQVGHLTAAPWRPGNAPLARSGGRDRPSPGRSAPSSPRR